MKIEAIKLIEDCMDGSFIKEILLSQVITECFIRYLAELGILHYYTTFPRPFFQIEAPDQFIIKGVEGNRTVRLILFKEIKDKQLSLIVLHINNFNTGNGGENGKKTEGILHSGRGIGRSERENENGGDNWCPIR